MLNQDLKPVYFLLHIFLEHQHAISISVLAEIFLVSDDMKPISRMNSVHLDIVKTKQIKIDIAALKSPPLIAIATAKEDDPNYSDATCVLKESSAEQMIQPNVDLGNIVKIMNTNIGEQEAVFDSI